MGTSLEELSPYHFSVLNWLVFTIALFVTSLRLVVRFKNFNRLFWEDVFVISGMVFLTLMAILNQISSPAIYLMGAIGDGQILHEFASPEDIASAVISQNKIQFCFMILFWTCLWSIKVSLLMFYLRLLDGVAGYMKWWWTVVGTCALTWIACILTNFTVCMPFTRRWSLDPEDICKTQPGLNSIWVSTGLDILTDILVGALPIKLIINLRVSLKQKLGVCGIFSLGIVIISIAIVRLVKMVEYVADISPKGNISIALWSILEAAVAVVVGSLPALRSLITRNGKTGHTQRQIPMKRTKTTEKVSTGAAASSHNWSNGSPAPKAQSTVRASYDDDEPFVNNHENGNIRVTVKHEIWTSPKVASDDHNMDAYLQID